MVCAQRARHATVRAVADAVAAAGDHPHRPRCGPGTGIPPLRLELPILLIRLCTLHGTGQRLSARCSDGIAAMISCSDMTGMCRRPRRRSCDRRPAARTRTITRQSGETCPHATGAAPPRRCTATCAATPHATRVTASPGGPGPAPARAPVRVRARALARNRASAGREAGPRAMSRSSGGASGAVGWRTTTAAAGAHARTPWIGAGDTRGTIGRSPRGVRRAPAATGPLPSERPRRGSGCPTSPTPGACCGYRSLDQVAVA